MHTSVIWIFSLRNVLIFSMIDDYEIIYLYLFAFNFLNNMLVLFSNILTSTLKRKITLANDACSRPPTTIRFHDLHAGNIRRVVCEITSYLERVQFFPFFWALRVVRLLAFPFNLPWDASGYRSFIGMFFLNGMNNIKTNI